MTPHQNCEHFPVCYYVKQRREKNISERFLCVADQPGIIMVCKMDTRSRPTGTPPAAPCLPNTPLCDDCYKDQIIHDKEIRNDERNQILDEAIKEIGISRDNLGREFTTGFETDEFDLPIISDEFDDLKQRINSLRHPSTKEQTP